MELSEDLLFGANRVAQFIGVEARTVYHWMERKRAGKSAPPVFDVGGQVCGRRSEMSSWFSGFREMSRPEQFSGGEDGAEKSASAVIHGKNSRAAKNKVTVGPKESEQSSEDRE